MCHRPPAAGWVIARRRLMAGVGAAMLARPALAAARDLRVGDQRGGIQPLLETAGVLKGADYTVQ